MASTMMAQDEVQNYGYNTRDELISGQGLTYNYDDIGNRTTAKLEELLPLCERLK